jgi:hypothetical protein
VTPFLRAMVLDFWMVGPSAMGSVKGRPSSIMSAEDACQICVLCNDREGGIPAPPASRPSMISAVSSLVGKPQVK